LKRKKSAINRIAPFLGFILIFSAGTLINGFTFLNIYNQLNVLGRVSIIALPAVGLTLVILTAGIDLSVGSIVSLSSVICAMLLMSRSWNRASWLAAPVFALVIGLSVRFLIRSRIKKRNGRKWIAETGSTGAGIAAGLLAFLFAALQVSSGFSTFSVLLILPATGIALGALNGLIISRGRIQPFIVTLGMMSAAIGLAKTIAGKGGQIHAIYYEAMDYTAQGTAHSAPVSFQFLSDKISIFGTDVIPVTALFFLASVILAHLFLTRFRWGRYIYAIGGNEETARLSGIRVHRVKTFVYAVSGGLSALAGVLYCSAYTQGKPDAGASWELDAIAAVVIGGTSLMGGKGSVLGTLAGVLILGYLGNILNLQAVPSEVQNILKGTIIIGAVLVQEGSILGWIRKIRGKQKENK
jgi:ribose/xylose/arabinose/galactoside ABC-type transport system permease subunit